MANNPLTGAPFSDQYYALEAKWSKLPAWLAVDKIKDSIRKYPLTFIISGTGSGKTVVTPRAALDVLDYKGKIGVTLPKREIVRSVSGYAAETMDVNLGESIGYIHKGSDKRLLGKDSKLVYMTDGILVSKFNQDSDIPEYDIVIIDEAHERKTQIDLILLYLKNLLLSGKREDFRAIIMSATIDTKKYKNYFKGIKSNIIEISGVSNYPIKINYLDEPTKNYIKTGSEILEKTITQKERLDALFFVTSGNEAMQVCRSITPGHPKLFCIEVFADMDPTKTVYAKEKDDFMTLGDYDRKVVIATNVAESSITIKGLNVVVDGGYELFSYFDPQVYGDVLEKRHITKAQAVQRRGRVGRTEAGTCYHLLTKEQFDALEQYPEPDILKQDLTIVLLQIIKMTPKTSLEEGKAMLNKLMDPPHKAFIESAENLYNMYQLIKDGVITQIGADVSRFSALPLNRSLFMLYGYQLHVLGEASIIVAMIEKTGGQVDNLFYKDSRKNVKQFVDPKSDHLTFYKIYQLWDASEDKDIWCKKYGIKCNQFRTIRNIAKQYYYQVSNMIKAHQLSRVDEMSTEKRIVSALKLSHKHLMKKIGVIDPNSVVDKKKAGKSRYLYDRLTMTRGPWKASTITII